MVTFFKEAESPFLIKKKTAYSEMVRRYEYI